MLLWFGGGRKIKVFLVLHTDSFCFVAWFKCVSVSAKGAEGVRWDLLALQGSGLGFGFAF